MRCGRQGDVWLTCGADCGACCNSDIADGLHAYELSGLRVCGDACGSMKRVRNPPGIGKGEGGRGPSVKYKAP